MDQHFECVFVFSLMHVEYKNQVRFYLEFTSILSHSLVIPPILVPSFSIFAALWYTFQTKLSPFTLIHSLYRYVLIIVLVNALCRIHIYIYVYIGFVSRTAKSYMID